MSDKITVLRFLYSSSAIFVFALTARAATSNASTTVPADRHYKCYVLQCSVSVARVVFRAFSEDDPDIYLDNGCPRVFYLISPIFIFLSFFPNNSSLQSLFPPPPSRLSLLSVMVKYSYDNDVWGGKQGF